MDANKTEFEKELTALINEHSLESWSNTPDFILAEYLMNCLIIFNTATQQRETWYGRDARPSEPTLHAKDRTGEILEIDRHGKVAESKLERCAYCDTPEYICKALWDQQKKCCPDCDHPHKNEPSPES